MSYHLPARIRAAVVWVHSKKSCLYNSALVPMVYSSRRLVPCALLDAEQRFAYLHRLHIPAPCSGFTIPLTFVQSTAHILSRSTYEGSTLCADCTSLDAISIDK